MAVLVSDKKLLTLYQINENPNIPLSSVIITYGKGKTITADKLFIDETGKRVATIMDFWNGYHNKKGLYIYNDASKNYSLVITSSNVSKIAVTGSPTLESGTEFISDSIYPNGKDERDKTYGLPRVIGVTETFNGNFVYVGTVTGEYTYQNLENIVYYEGSTPVSIKQELEKAKNEFKPDTDKCKKLISNITTEVRADYAEDKENYNNIVNEYAKGSDNYTNLHAEILKNYAEGTTNYNNIIKAVKGKRRLTPEIQNKINEEIENQVEKEINARIKKIVNDKIRQEIQLRFQKRLNEEILQEFRKNVEDKDLSLEDAGTSISMICLGVFNLETKATATLESGFKLNEDGSPILTGHDDSGKPIYAPETVKLISSHIEKRYKEVNGAHMVETTRYARSVTKVDGVEKENGEYILVKIQGYNEPIIVKAIGEDTQLFTLDDTPIKDDANIKLQVNQKLKVKINGETFTTEPLTYQQANLRYDTVKSMQTVGDDKKLGDNSYLRLANGKYVKESEFVRPIAYNYAEEGKEDKADAYLFMVGEGDDKKTYVLSKDLVEKQKSKSAKFTIDGEEINVNDGVALVKSTKPLAECDVIQTSTNNEKGHQSCVVVRESSLKKDAKPSNDEKTKAKEAYGKFIEGYKNGTYTLEELLVNDEFIKLANQKYPDQNRYELTDKILTEDYSYNKPAYKFMDEQPINISEDGKITGGPSYSLKASLKDYFKNFNTAFVPTLGLIAAGGLFAPFIAIPVLAGFGVAAAVGPIVNLVKFAIEKIKTKHYQNKNEINQKELVKEINADLTNLYETILGEYKSIVEKYENTIKNCETEEQKKTAQDIMQNELNALKGHLNSSLVQIKTKMDLLKGATYLTKFKFVNGSANVDRTNADIYEANLKELKKRAKLVRKLTKQVEKEKDADKKAQLQTELDNAKEQLDSYIKECEVNGLKVEDNNAYEGLEKKFNTCAGLLALQCGFDDEFEVATERYDEEINESVVENEPINLIKQTVKVRNADGIEETITIETVVVGEPSVYTLPDGAILLENNQTTTRITSSVFATLKDDQKIQVMQTLVGRDRRCGEIISDIDINNLILKKGHLDVKGIKYEGNINDIIDKLKEYGINFTTKFTAKNNTANNVINRNETDAELRHGEEAHAEETAEHTAEHTEETVDETAEVEKGTRKKATEVEPQPITSELANELKSVIKAAKILNKNHSTLFTGVGKDATYNKDVDPEIVEQYNEALKIVNQKKKTKGFRLLKAVEDGNYTGIKDKTLTTIIELLNTLKIITDIPSGKGRYEAEMNRVLSTYAAIIKENADTVEV